LLAGPAQLETLFLATATTVTSVGITAQVLAANNLLRRTAAVIDDILALLLLDFVSSFASGEVDLVQIALTTLFALGFIAVVARWGGAACGWAAKWLEAQLQVVEVEFRWPWCCFLDSLLSSRPLGRHRLLAHSWQGWPFGSRFFIGCMNPRTG